MAPTPRPPRRDRTWRPCSRHDRLHRAAVGGKVEASWRVRSRLDGAVLVGANVAGNLMPHFGGYHCGSGDGYGANLCLMRVRPEEPLKLGWTTRAYLPTSQK